MPEMENNTNAPADESANGAEKEAKKQVYELGYLLLPTTAEESTPVIFGNLKEQIANLGGEIISSDMPRMMHLAYVMTKVIQNVRQKFDSAYFGWIKFDIEAGKMADLKKMFDANPDFIRFLIVKTVRESTIAPRRYVGAGVGRTRVGLDRKEDKTESAPIDKAEIDKEIDALAEAAV